MVDDAFFGDNSLLIMGEFPPASFSELHREPFKEDMSLPMIEDVFSIAKDLGIDEVDEPQEMEVTAQTAPHKLDDTVSTSRLAQKDAMPKCDAQQSENPAGTVSSQPAIQDTTAVTTPSQPSQAPKLSQKTKTQNTSSLSIASSVGVQKPPSDLLQFTLQKIMCMRQASIQSQNMNIPQMSIPSMGILQNVGNVPVNQQQINMLQNMAKASLNQQQMNMLQNMANVPVNQQQINMLQNIANASLNQQQINMLQNMANVSLNQQQMNMLQNMTNVHVNQQQMNILQNMTNVPVSQQQMNMLQNMTSVPVNQQKVNMLQLGIPRPGAGLAPLGTLQNRIAVPRVPLQPQRVSVPQLNLQLPSPSVRPLGVRQSAGCVSQFGGAQLNVLKNIGLQLKGTSTQQLGMQQQALPLAQLNALAGMQTEQRNASQLAMQVHGQQLHQPVGGSHILQQNLLNAQQQRTAGKSGITSVSQLTTNSSQVTNSVSQLRTAIPQLRVPQLGNMMQFRAPQLANIPQLRMPQVAATMQQLARSVRQFGVPSLVSNVPRMGVPRLAPNVPRMGVPRLAPNVPPVGIPQLRSNIQQMGVPHIPSNMPRLSVPQLAANSSSMPQLARSVPQLPVPRVATTSGSRFSVPLLTTNVPPLTVPQSASNIPSLGVPPGNACKLSMQQLASQLSMSQAGTNIPPLGVQPVATSMPQVASSVPRLGTSQSPMNWPRFGVPQRATNVPRLRMPQPAHLQLQRTGAPQVIVPQLAQMAQLAAKQRSMRMPWTYEKQQVAGGQQKVTGVKHQLSGVLQQSVNTSQQSASAPQPVGGQKHIVSHPANMHHQMLTNQTGQIILKHIQRKRVKQQLALLNLWKRYEKYRIAKLFYEANRKNLLGTRKRRLLIQQQQLVALRKLQLMKAPRGK